MRTTTAMTIGFATNSTTTATPMKGGRGFGSGFLASLSAILVSELGDKTFFIAALLAMRNGRITVFSGALAALATMTLLSACGGKLVTLIIPRDFTFYISAALFLIFGLKMLHEGYMMTPEEAAAEMEEVQQELGERRPAAAAARERRDVERREELQLSLVNSMTREDSGVGNDNNNNNNDDDDNSGASAGECDVARPEFQPQTKTTTSSSSSTFVVVEEIPASPPTPSPCSRHLPSPRQFGDRIKNSLCSFFRRRILVSAMGVPLSHAFVQACTLTFLAEWGDRSQMATIALASGEDVFGVIVGGVLGHAVCTGSAVIGGRLLAARISVRHVTIFGGIVFIVFAFVAIGVGPEEHHH